MSYTHLDPLRRELAALNLSYPPHPWRVVATVAVGGLRAVGFDRHSELLLVTSTNGRSVIDGATGQRLARDGEEYTDGEVFLEAVGIGPLANRVVRMAGLFGGGLPAATEDG
jgi:hypothetical protein